MYPLMSVRPELRTANRRTGKRVSPMSTACSFCDRSANVLSVSYTVHIRFVRYTSVKRTLVDRSLSVACSVRMLSLRLPRRFSPPLRHLPSPDKQFLHIFCPFGVRYLYPFICDSTIRVNISFPIYLRITRFIIKLFLDGYYDQTQKEHRFCAVYTLLI